MREPQRTVLEPQRTVLNRKHHRYALAATPSACPSAGAPPEAAPSATSTATTGWPTRPSADGDDALRVNWLEIVSARPDGAVAYRGAFVASVGVDRDNVAELADCARARWKIENETVNVLKQHGCHLEHNFGHGQKTLAAVLVVVNLLAFALHTACDLAEDQWQRARQRLGTRARLFEHLRTVAEYQVFPSWNALMVLLATGGPAAQPP